MTEPHADIDLPRFSRRVGVTGLARVDEGTGGRSPSGVCSPFAGVLETVVQDGGQRGPTPHLAYLTLAPLVAPELARTAASSEHSGRSDGDATDSTPTADDTAELRVHEVLRDVQRERATDVFLEASVAETADRGSDSDGSALATLERTVRDLRGDPPATESPPTDTADLPDWRLDTGSRNRPDVDAGTVVDVPAPDAEASSAGPSRQNEWSSIDPEATAVFDQPGTDAPAMTVVEARGSDPGRAGRDTENPAVVVDAASPDTGDSSRSDPDLTVERAGRIQRSSGETPPAVGTETAAPRTQDEQDDQTAPPRGGDGRSEIRTVLQPDGSVNERVLDRLYQELTRKQRLERSREGQ